jgi:hypothetical protein
MRAATRLNGNAAGESLGGISVFSFIGFCWVTFPKFVRLG